MVTRNLSLRRLARLAFVATFTLPAVVAASDLTQLLMSKVGVTQPQAIGGAGSIFKLAQAQMTAENFQKIAAVVPSMKTYLGAAQSLLPQIAAPAASALPAAGSVGALTQGATTPAAATASTGNGMRANALDSTALAAALAAGTNALPLAMPAPATPSGTALLAGKAAQLVDPSGKWSGALKSAETLAPAFEKLGMKPTLVAKFVPVVSDYLKHAGGKSTAKLLLRALGL